MLVWHTLNILHIFHGDGIQVSETHLGSYLLDLGWKKVESIHITTAPIGISLHKAAEP